eukprot:3452722-Pyramimonas_sp.AAC.1
MGGFSEPLLACISARWFPVLCLMLPGKSGMYSCHADEDVMILVHRGSMEMPSLSRGDGTVDNPRCCEDGSSGRILWRR